MIVLVFEYLSWIDAKSKYLICKTWTKALDIYRVAECKSSLIVGSPNEVVEKLRVHPNELNCFQTLHPPTLALLMVKGDNEFNKLFPLQSFPVQSIIIWCKMDSAFCIDDQIVSDSNDFQTQLSITCVYLPHAQVQVHPCIPRMENTQLLDQSGEINGIMVLGSSRSRDIQAIAQRFPGVPIVGGFIRDFPAPSLLLRCPEKDGNTYKLSETTSISIVFGENCCLEAASSFGIVPSSPVVNYTCPNKEPWVAERNWTDEHGKCIDIKPYLRDSFLAKSVHRDQVEFSNLVRPPVYITILDSSADSSIDDGDDETGSFPGKWCQLYVVQSQKKQQDFAFSLELARKEITSHGIKPVAAFSFFSRIDHIDRDYLSFKRIFPGIALTGASYNYQIGQRNYNEKALNNRLCFEFHTHSTDVAIVCSTWRHR